MAKAKKSIPLQLWEAQQRKAQEKAALEKKQRDAAAKAALAADKAALKAQAAEARRVQREADARVRRENAADLRAVQQVMREMERRETLRVQHELKEEGTRAKEKERQAKADGVQRQRDEALRRTRDIENTLEAIAGILTHRDRDLEFHRDETDEVFDLDGAESYAERVAAILAERSYTGGRALRVAYAPENRRLTLMIDLPRKSRVPEVKAYKYVAARGEIVAEPRKPAEIHQIYRAAIASMTLCLADYAAAVTSPELVDVIAVNAHVSTKDPATGQPVNPCLVTFLAERAAFGRVLLDEEELDPVRCLHHLDARVSPNPYDLEPVVPIIDFGLERFKLVEEEAVLAPLDGRVDLLALSPSDFERLIEKLFLAMGYKAWKTRDSRDDGVDAVAVSEDIALGGVCVIQAKRYRKTVPPEAVRALSGTMQQMKAVTGWVVTTSTFGPASYAFAEDVGRIRLIDNRGLVGLLKKYLGMEVLVGAPPAGGGRHPRRTPAPSADPTAAEESNRPR